MTKISPAVIGGGGLGAVLLIYMLSRSSTPTEGVSYSAPDPNAVNAALGGVAAEITANNQLAVDRAKVASDTILGLANAQGGLYADQINGNNALATARVNTQAEEATTQLTTKAATDQANIAANANVAAANAASTAAENIAKAAADAQVQVAEQQTAQANAARPSWFQTLMGSASGILTSLGGLGLKL